MNCVFNKIAVACDQAGYHLKNDIIKFLSDNEVTFVDLGTYNTDSVDYPDYAHLACEAIAYGKADGGILICGTGIGMSMAANKHKGIRAACCADTYSARMTRLHNDANVLCMGARVVGAGLAADITEIFLTTGHEDGRHAVRVKLIMDNEKNWN
jgi:ribose 5-phosphate isomerase B